jgi:Big-like domain-containing protein/IPT/TIG domain-containing protein/galactose oxidase-like protein
VDQTASLLTNGQLLVAGGYTACSSSCVSDSTTELFGPQADNFTAGQSLSAARSQHTATLLNDGTVLLVGGINNGQSLSNVDVYHPSSLALPQLASITITPANPSIAPGATQPLTAMGFDSSANLLGTLQAVIWSSSAPSVATVTNAAGSAGIVDSLSTGTTTITATVGGVTGSTQVTVAAPPSLVSLAITPSNPSITLNFSAPLQLDVKGTYSDGSTQDLTTSATWNTSNSSIAQILADPNAPGVVFGVSTGAADITAAYNGINTSTPITVLPTPAPPNPTIASISPTSGVPGTQVVINGSGFGGSQANAYILLGSTPGVVSSWSDTQIVAVVANGSTSGTAQVEEGEVSSNSLPFTVNMATISAVSPTSGVAGTQVAITGSGFGSTQGNGLVWLGNAVGVVTNWTDTEVDAGVAPGALSGNAQVLQNGEWSNAFAFTVPGNPLISSISPNSGPTGTTVTISGSGFGSSQGSGIVSIGTASAAVLSWSDTQIQATVSGTAVTGVAKIQENNMWSNAKAFTVTGNFGSNPAVTLMPDVVSMSVGDARTLQAVDSNNQPVTGLTWSSSDTNIASLSTDDPPLITAIAAGNVTITAGTGSADITVYAGALPLGTTIWSNPGNASGVQQIVPAVPSSTGIADVFALQNDCSVQAIASNGTPGWTANIGSQSSQLFGGGCKNVVPDFQGGFLSVDKGNPQTPGTPGAIQKFDGITGQPYPAYSVTTPRESGSRPPSLVVPHTDGTIFTIDGDSLIGIDPSTGRPKVTAKMEHSTFPADSLPNILSKLIVAGDGYAYLIYDYETGSDTGNCPPNIDCTETVHTEKHARMLRVATSGDSSELDLGDWSEDDTYTILYIPNPPGSPLAFTTVGQHTEFGVLPFEDPDFIITNGDQGIFAALYFPSPGYCAFVGNSEGEPDVTAQTGCVAGNNNIILVTTSGSSVTLRVTVPDTINYINPILQAQDGTFYGIVDYTGGEFDNLAKFDSSGNIQWSKPNYYALMATSDGGVIAQTAYPYTHSFTGLPFYSGPAITFDANGNQTGQVANLPEYSWKGAYQYGSVNSVIPFLDLGTKIASSFAAAVPGNIAGTGAFVPQHTVSLVWCNSLSTGVCGQGDQVVFSYAPADVWDNQNLLTPVNVPPDWTSGVQSQAFLAFKEAFAKYPVLVSLGQSDHTVYVVGGIPVSKGGTYPCADTNAASSGVSVAYYLINMSEAQVALGSWLNGVVNGTWQNLSLSYPPTTSQGILDFKNLSQAAGRGIGFNSAHEIGHQFSLPKMDCTVGIVSSNECDNDDSHVLEYNSCRGDPDSVLLGSSPTYFYYGQRIYTGEALNWGPSNSKNLCNQLLGGNSTTNKCK